MRNEPRLWGTGVNREGGVRPPSLGHRFLGGPPLTVLLRLVFVSLLVGAVLMWLRLEPLDVVRDAIHTAERLWAMGYDAFGQIGRYILAGAVIVVPVWFVIRLLSFRTIGRTSPDTRWTAPGEAAETFRSEPKA